MKRLIIGLIRIYQKTLSPDHGPLRFLHPTGACRFHPTCSEYGARAFEKYGLWKGLIKTLGRVGRCHPFTEGGVDEP